MEILCCLLVMNPSQRRTSSALSLLLIFLGREERIVGVFGCVCSHHSLTLDYCVVYWVLTFVQLTNDHC